MPESTLTARLNENAWRNRLANHEFFERVKSRPVERGQVALFVGQWWHPLHYFPTFLSRCISVLPDIESKAAVTKILYQETGEGDPRRAHEVIYADTMVGAGFTRAEATMAPAYPETRSLVAGYERASADRFAALGFIFATEVTDLAMVSGIGTAVERATGKKDLEWVNIHVRQEPDHVEEADHTILRAFGADEEALVMDGAAEMWRLWVAFFDRLLDETFHAGR
jgi:pyrroloquinoline quinone (PQQ) biosynthesis protein C